MHSFWQFFLERRSFTILVMLALAGAGLYSLFAIPKESAPEVEVPVGIVITTLRGASASDVESLLTNKIEEELGNLEDLDTLTSISREGVSSITAQFTAQADLDKSIQDLKDAIDRVKPELPREADEPIVTRINFAEQPIMIVSVSGNLSDSSLAKLGEELKSEIKGVSGVSDVSVSGVRDRETQVVIRGGDLQEFGLSLNEVVAAISGSNASIPIGGITVDGIDYAVNFKGDIDNPEEVKDLVVGVKNGVSVRVRDIADVVDGLAKTTTFSRVSVEGEPSEQSLTLNIFKKSGGDITRIGDAVKEKFAELEDSTLDGATVAFSYDAADLVKKDLTDLSEVGIETVILVMGVLLLSIGWRESLVAGLSIPLSFLIAFVGLYVSGNTINFVSLFSLILAIGILVDSGIVVTEAIHTRYRRLKNAKEAAILSIKEYAWPLIAGTMTTVAVFIPLFFLSGIIGEFISSIPFTIVFVLFASIFVALGLVPFIAIYFAKEEQNKLEVIQEEYTHRAQEWYRNKLGSLLDNRRLQNWFFAALGVAFVFAFVLPSSGLMKVIFFPEEDSDFIYIEIEEAQGTPLRETDRVVREVEEALYGDTRFDSFTTTVGQGSFFAEGTVDPKLANITITLKKDREQTSSEILTDLKKKVDPIRGADIRVLQPSGGPPTGAPVVITIIGEDFNDIERATLEAETILSTIPGATDITTSLRNDATEFVLTIDRERAAELGLSPSIIAQTLRTAVSGAIATTIKQEEKDIEVLVKLNLNPSWNDPEDTARATIESLRLVPIATPQGSVLLGSVIDVDIQKSATVIRHEDKKRIATVGSQLAPGANTLVVTAAFSEKLSEITPPPGVEIKVGGENEDIDQSFKEMFLALIAGVILMLGILVLEFNSFRYSFYLLFTVPLALIGVFTGLTITGNPLSFSSLLGVIALSGVIINHAIILMDSMVVRLEDPKFSDLKSVVVDAAISRLRPIFLTTITTVVGMIPLAGVSALWSPLAFAIMFGLTFSTILTLVFIPVLFYRWPGKAIREKFISIK